MSTLQLEKRYIEQSSSLLKLLKHLQDQEFIDLDIDQSGNLISVKILAPEAEKIQQALSKIHQTQLQRSLFLNIIYNAQHEISKAGFANYLEKINLQSAMIDLGLPFKGNTLMGPNLQNEKPKDSNFYDTIENLLLKEFEKITTVVDAVCDSETQTSKEQEAWLIEPRKLNTKALLRAVQQIKGQIAIAKYKSLMEEKALTKVYEKNKQLLNGIASTLESIQKFKCEDEIKMLEQQLFYQELLTKNLHLFRQYLESKMRADIYSEEKVKALRFIHDALEQRINTMKSSRSFLTERTKILKEKVENNDKFKSKVKQIQILTQKIEQAKYMTNLSEQLQCKGVY